MDLTHVILVRSIFSFFFLLLIARILGKKQVSQLTFFDYVVGITIGSTASTLAIEMNTSAFAASIGMLVYALFSFFLNLAATKSNWMNKFLEGEPSVLVEKGKLMEKNMLRNRITLQELMMMLREKSIFKLADVEYAILENNGNVSVQKKAESEPVTPGDLGMSVPYKGLPSIVIQDGRPIYHRLRELGITLAWLKEKLSSQGIKNIKDVFTAQLDSSGELYVDTYVDMEGAQPDRSNQMMLASLAGLMADLETFSLETENEEASQVYQSCRNKIKGVVEEFRPYVEKELIKKGEPDNE